MKCCKLIWIIFQGELKHSLDISKPKFIFVSAINANNVIPKIKNLNYVQKIILLDDGNIDEPKIISFKKFVDKYENTEFDIESQIRRPINLFDQVALIFMSSGTTGLPKGSLRLTFSSWIEISFPLLFKAFNFHIRIWLLA